MCSRKRQVFDENGHVHFVTFSCYKRRRILDTRKACEIVVSFLSSQLQLNEGQCLGFVVMPDHVHAAVWFDEPGKLSRFMQQWKRRTSLEIKQYLRKERPNYLPDTRASQPMWQPRYYDFNIRSESKLNEKLTYMHMNPVKAGLVGAPEEYPFSSARHYLLDEPVGVDIASV